MPTLAAPLDFAKLEGRNFRGHVLGSAPAAPVTGQLYYNTGDNTLYWYDGTQWVSARGGAAAIGDATTSSKGVIQLAGDLAGTATSPQIAAGVITDADVNAANKDGAAATPGMRTLGLGAAQAMPGNTRLDGITQPVNPVNLNGMKIIALADPVGNNDAANKNYVDIASAAAAQGLDAKPSVKVASTANINVNGGAFPTIDGVATTTDDRVLLKDQTNPAENGIWGVDFSGWYRVQDMNVWAEVPSAFVFVERGTINGDTGWLCISDQGGTLGTTAIAWTQFSAAGQIVGGAGLTKTGQTLDVGAGPGITVNPDTIQVANDGITNAMLADGAVNVGSADITGQVPVNKGGTGANNAKQGRESGLGAAGYYSSATHGAGTSITIAQFTHSLRGTKGLLVQVQDEATGNVVLADISVNTSGDVTVTFGASVGANTMRVTIIG